MVIDVSVRQYVSSVEGWVERQYFSGMRQSQTVVLFLIFVFILICIVWYSGRFEVKASKLGRMKDVVSN